MEETTPKKRKRQVYIQSTTPKKQSTTPKKPKNNEIHITQIPGFAEYYRTVKKKLRSHQEEIKQEGRHLAIFVSYSVFDRGLLNLVQSKPILPRPRIDIYNIKKELTHYTPLSIAKPALDMLVGNQSIGCNSSFDWIVKIFSDYEDYNIDNHTALTTIISVMHHKPSSEIQVKSDLWNPIFRTSFSLAENPFEYVWEFYHQFPGDSGEGSSRSDFAAVVTKDNKKRFPFFIVEFEKGITRKHKDHAVIVSEAAFEMTRILSNVGDQSDDQVLQITLHAALISQGQITFGTFRPMFNNSATHIAYVHDQNVKTFDLGNSDPTVKIKNSLDLIVYLRKVICQDGLTIQRLINAQPSHNEKILSHLPEIPPRAEVSRFSKANITPPSLQTKFIIHDTN